MSDKRPYEAKPPPFPCHGWMNESSLDEYVWGKAGEKWSADPQGRCCSFGGCSRPAVMRLNREAIDRRRGGRSPRWYAYCEVHNYGRVVHDGAVWEPRPADLDRADKGSSND